MVNTYSLIDGVVCLELSQKIFFEETVLLIKDWFDIENEFLSPELYKTKLFKEVSESLTLKIRSSQSNVKGVGLEATILYDKKDDHENLLHDPAITTFILKFYKDPFTVELVGPPGPGF